MFKKMRKLATTKLASKIIYWIINSYSSTFRFSMANEESWLKYLEGGGRVLLCGWHQQFFSSLSYFKKYEKYHPTFMASKSLDGAIATGVGLQMGWHPVRGSSSRDGGFALKEMTDRLKKHGLAVLLLDGPRGPAGIVKPGVIKLAHTADAVIVPAYAQAEKAWYFNSWDKFMIPKPFSRVSIVFCDMIKLPPDQTDADLENQRLRLESILRPYLKK
jgi:lysophospholipid acyltransferase (LPLAT)-like uncharacterized protein